LGHYQRNRISLVKSQLESPTLAKANGILPPCPSTNTVESSSILEESAEQLDRGREVEIMDISGNTAHHYPWKWEEPKQFHRHRFDYMGEIDLFSTLVEDREDCVRYAHPFAHAPRDGSTQQQPNCVAIVRTNKAELASSPIIRFKPLMPKLNDPGADGHGFFTKVTIERSRTKTALKWSPFIRQFDAMEKYIKSRLLSKGYREQGVEDLVIMVVNEGEFDLFMNLACSCELHGISMNNFVVFAGNPEMLSQIEGVGALGLYHSGFAAVAKAASHDYLDFTFVDMMWYKCFSVYMILREGFNILFQDVDLVWFKDPFPFFKEILEKDAKAHPTVAPLDALLSDDGQRSLRYTPFFANSGFYYLRSNPRSIYMTYGIMISFPMIQRLGSHQNMYTQRLIETQTQFGMRSYFLGLEDFPNGFLYHHGRDYMKRLKEKKVAPFMFHMCWTQGKVDKLKYMKKSGMWYISKDIGDDVKVMKRRMNPLKGPIKGETNWSGSSSICDRKPDGWH